MDQRQRRSRTRVLDFFAGITDVPRPELVDAGSPYGSGYFLFSFGSARIRAIYSSRHANSNGVGGVTSGRDG